MAIRMVKDPRKSNLGRSFEERIRWQNKMYLQQGVAQVHKVPTEWIPLRNSYGQIVNAKVEEKAAVDFMGTWADLDGKSLAFDAKQFKGTNFPLKNVPSHQVEFLRNHIRFGGIGFALLEWTDHHEVRLLPGDQLLEAVERAESGGRKSLSEDELITLPLVSATTRGPCDYLAVLKDVLIGGPDLLLVAGNQH